MFRPLFARVGPTLRWVRHQSTEACQSTIQPKAGTSTTLRHLHFTDTVSYETGLGVQEKFVAANLDFKNIRSRALRQIEAVKSGKMDTDEGPAQVSQYEENLVAKMLKDIKPGPLVLTFQFNPVYTGGKREKDSHSEQELEIYNFKGAHYVQSSRGGQVTYHGPGQVVAYSIIDLNDFKKLDAKEEQNELTSDNDIPQMLKKDRRALPPRCFVNGLEQSIINTLSSGHKISRSMSAASRTPYGIDSFRTENTGVWVAADAKIASIGVHVRRGVTSHGVAINVNTDLDYPNKFVMCGIDNAKTTSMKEIWEKENQSREVSIRDVSYSYACEFAKVFGFKQVEHYDVIAENFIKGVDGAYSHGIKEIL
ncbi:lipoyl(octanoyl) transferase [Saccharomycopsis crataegensis]|uniref:lipoyl(octanoyl) transferase n=1 Tax=Saccharomycopsis crataegensis TaxID=43959 RepID=A0AAV5QM54_9ASCO|nr:lipoyl(octanoyl) transferase [Saccharomycopsis crataegensis]